MQAHLFLNLGVLSDAELVEGLHKIIGSGRRLQAELLAHLCEVEDRRLHLDAGSPSLVAYCMARLGGTEDEAYRRLNVARVARRAPIVFRWIAEGRLSLSVAALLQPHVMAPNLEQLIEAVAGKSVKAAREALVVFFPRPDIVSSIRKLPRAHVPVSPTIPSQAPRPSAPATVVSAPDSSETDTLEASVTLPGRPAPPVARPSSFTEPLSPGRFKIQFTADATLKDRLELARDLLRHAVPSGDLAIIVRRALDLLVTDLQKRRFGATSKPKPWQPKSPVVHAPGATVASAQPDARSETVANGGTLVTDVHALTSERATRRAVSERDGFRCTWQGPDGVRCSSTSWLEQDHRIPRALGGTTSVQNLRLLCRAHNQRAAELVFGRRHIEQATMRRRPHASCRPPART